MGPFGPHAKPACVLHYETLDEKNRHTSSYTFDGLTTTLNGVVLPPGERKQTAIKPEWGPKSKWTPGDRLRVNIASLHYITSLSARMSVFAVQVRKYDGPTFSQAAPTFCVKNTAFTRQQYKWSITIRRRWRRVISVGCRDRFFHRTLFGFRHYLDYSSCRMGY